MYLGLVHITDLTGFRLAVAAADFGLHLLTKSSAEDEFIFPFGGGLSGHHGKVNDMSFCGGRSHDSARYVATVSGTGILFILSPTSSEPYTPRRQNDDGLGLASYLGYLLSTRLSYRRDTIPVFSTTTNGIRNRISPPSYNNKLASINQQRVPRL